MSTQIVDYNITDGAISKLRSQYAEVKEYKTVSAALSHVKGLRGDVEKRRIELKADALAWGKKVDTEAKRITALLFEIEEPLKLTKKEHDDEKERIRAEKARIEQERVDSIKQRVEEINQYLYKGLKCFESASVRKILDNFDAFEELDKFDYQEFKEQAASTKEDVLTKLEELLEAIILKEEKEFSEAAERERIRAEIEVQRIDQAKREEEFRLEREAFRQQQADKEKALEAYRQKLESQRLEDEKNQPPEAKWPGEGMPDKMLRYRALEAERQSLEAQRLEEVKKSLPEVKAEPRNIMNVQQRMQLDPNEPKDAKDMAHPTRYRNFVTFF